MAQFSGFEKPESKSRDNAWSDDHDCIPLKQRLKLLLANQRLSEEPEKSKAPIGCVVKEEDDERCDSRDCFTSLGEGTVERLLLQKTHDGDVGECNNKQGIEADECISLNQMEKSSEVDGTVTTERVYSSEVSSLQISVPYKYLFKAQMECTDNLTSSMADCVNSSSGADEQSIKIKTEIADDCLDDLDHIVLKKRQRMLLSRKSLGWKKPIMEGNSSELSAPIVDDVLQCRGEPGKEESFSGDRESSMAGNYSYDIAEGNTSVFWDASKSGSASNAITRSSCEACPLPACQCQLTDSTKLLSASTKQQDKMFLSMKTPANHELCGRLGHLSNNYKTMLSSALLPLVNVKVEPLDNNHLPKQDENAVGSLSFSNIVPVKCEFDILDESYGDIADHMLLRERMKLVMRGEIPNLNTYGNLECSKKIVPSALDATPIVTESAKPLRILRPRKRKKTATDSVETALEEDAPGLLQVLINKGVLVNEMKLYGEAEDNEALDESFTEDSFTELEAVMSKLFSQRSSLLKLAPIRCTKGEKASYCLPCLISLVEQARYLQFRKWPVEWGWCRDLQSFIFVFQKHNRIVLERPEYGYATYFFELVDSFSIDWQIKRLVTAMKLTSCSRVTLIENKALLVGEDLTEGEARVLMEYGWIPNSGLGTMLNYCDRVVHDRKNERDISDWRSKIGKLLVDGYNGGTIISADIPKKVMECSAAQSPQIKLEL